MRVYRENIKNFGGLGSFSTSDFSVYYYPGGMLMPGRHSSSADYRFGYNGMEMDNEPKGNGNSYTTEFRQYDPRLMRWLSLDPLMMKFPWMSPYVAFDNNPIYFTDPLGLESGPAKDKKLDIPKIETGSSGSLCNDCPQQYIPEMQVIGKKLPDAQIAQNQRDAILERGKFGGPEYDNWRKSPDAFSKSKSMINSGGYTSDDHYRNYKKNNWINADLQTYRMNPREHLEAKIIWGDPISEIKQYTTTAVVAGLTGGIGAGVSSLVGGGVFLSGTITGGINATMNFTSQLYANGGNFRNVDVLSTGTAFVSGYLPGKTNIRLLGNSIIAGTVDATFDYTISNGFKSILIKNKSLGLTISDFGFSTLGNAGGLSFGKNPFLMEAVGTGVTTFPTALGNKIVNNIIEK